MTPTDITTLRELVARMRREAGQNAGRRDACIRETANEGFWNGMAFAAKHWADILEGTLDEMEGKVKRV